jgi:hypothetical protein
MKSGNVGPASSSLHRGLLLVVVVLLQSFAHLLALTQGGLLVVVPEQPRARLLSHPTHSGAHTGGASSTASGTERP